jgi:hypothetical protein
VGNMLELEHSQMTRNTGTMQYGQIIWMQDEFEKERQPKEKS